MQTENIPFSDAVQAVTAVRIWDNAIRQAFGITMTQAAVLNDVHDHEGQFAHGATLGEIASAHNVSPAVVTGLVDRLERMGLAERRPPIQGGDRRQVYVGLTDKGRELLAKLKAYA